MTTNVKALKKIALGKQLDILEEESFGISCTKDPCKIRSYVWLLESGCDVDECPINKIVDINKLSYQCQQIVEDTCSTSKTKGLITITELTPEEEDCSQNCITINDLN